MVLKKGLCCSEKKLQRFHLEWNRAAMLTTYLFVASPLCHCQ